MTEEKTKEVVEWAKDIARWIEIPQSWVWHLAEYHPETYEELRRLTESGDEDVYDEVLCSLSNANAFALLETIKQREGCEEWARQAYLEEFGEPLSEYGNEEEIEYVKETWKAHMTHPEVAYQKRGYEYE